MIFVSALVVLFPDKVDVFLSKLFAEFRKSILEVLLSDLAAAINVESIEDREESVVSQKSFEFDLGGQELSVIDFVIFGII